MELKPSHATIRGKQRLNLSPENVKALQAAADRMWYGDDGRKKLNNQQYFSKINDDHNNRLGYAQFRKVGPPTRERLILATILSHEMHPKGEDISHFFNTKLKDKVKPHPSTPGPYKGMDAIPNNAKN